MMKFGIIDVFFAAVVYDSFIKMARLVADNFDYSNYHRFWLYLIVQVFFLVFLFIIAAIDKRPNQ